MLNLLKNRWTTRNIGGKIEIDVDKRVNGGNVIVTMTKSTKVQKKSTVSAVSRINSLSKARFKSVVKKSTSSSEVLRNLGIYQNGRNVEAVKNRISSDNLSLRS